MRIDLVKIWKCFHAEVDVGLCSLFELARSDVTRGHSLKMAVPICRSEVRRRSLAVRCVGIWNSLPESLIGASSQESFKHGLGVFFGFDGTRFVGFSGLSCLASFRWSGFAVILVCNL